MRRGVFSPVHAGSWIDRRCDRFDRCRLAVRCGWLSVRAVWRIERECNFTASGSQLGFDLTRSRGGRRFDPPRFSTTAMTPEDAYEVPFDLDPESADDSDRRTDSAGDSAEELVEEFAADRDSIDLDDRREIQAARQAFDDDDAAISDAATDDAATDDAATEDAAMDDEVVVSAAVPFVESWNDLVSTSNWEKGRIITSWRSTLVASGADAIAYSDRAWVRRVGGVTAPHVGRLRRVYDRFADVYSTYDGLYWTHFLAALDWDDAPMWLEGAVQEKWSVSAMREARWRAGGGLESDRPTDAQIHQLIVEGGDDISGIPAQGGRDRTYDGDGPGTSGPASENPDFGDGDYAGGSDSVSLGDGDELISMGNPDDSDSQNLSGDDDASAAGKPIQPFRDLPELPDDLSDAVESIKLAILRHKTAGWESTDAETVERYLKAIAVLLHS